MHRDLILKVLLRRSRSRAPVGLGNRQEGCWIRDDEQGEPGGHARLDQCLWRFGVARPQADTKRRDPDALEPRNVSLPPDPAGRKDQTSGQQQLTARDIRRRVDQLRDVHSGDRSVGKHESVDRVQMRTQCPAQARHRRQRHAITLLIASDTVCRDEYRAGSGVTLASPGTVAADSSNAPDFPSSDAISTPRPMEFEPTHVISSFGDQVGGRVPAVREPLMSGFPPPAESQVTLANWQDPPYNRWSFQHLREVIPTQRISRGMVLRPALAPLTFHQSLDDVMVHRLGGHRPRSGT